MKWIVAPASVFLTSSRIGFGLRNYTQTKSTDSFSRGKTETLFNLALYTGSLIHILYGLCFNLG